MATAGFPSRSEETTSESLYGIGCWGLHRLNGFHVHPMSTENLEMLLSWRPLSCTPWRAVTAIPLGPGAFEQQFAMALPTHTVQV